MSSHDGDWADAPANAPKIGILGAGRTRQGLGPFLARWLEKAGATVNGVAGREFTRAQATAVEISKQLGHSVAAYENAEHLAANVDALVVACPVEGHLAGLDAALEAGVPCLCEKPFVAAAQTDEALQRLAGFRERGLLLVENCQWPFTVPALHELHPELRDQPVRSLAMRLSPAAPGRVMIEDSLSHVLSLLQALVPLPADSQLAAVVESDPAPTAEQNVVRFEVTGGTENVAVALHLQCCPQQPRPAWYEVNGARIDRRLGSNYEISFAANDGRVVNVEDPLARLVYGFIANLKRTPVARTYAFDSIELRLRLYSEILNGL